MNVNRCNTKELHLTHWDKWWSVGVSKRKGLNQMTKPNLSAALRTIEDGKAFIEALHGADMMFHFEDSPETIIKGRSDEPLFTRTEAKQVRDRVAELYAMDWATVGHECPIGYALEVMERAGTI
jgi:hypothetical protein